MRRWLVFALEIWFCWRYFSSRSPRFLAAPIRATFPDLRLTNPKSGEPTPQIEIEGGSEITSELQSFIVDFQLDFSSDLTAEEEDEPDLPRTEVQIRYDVVVGVGSSSPSQEASSSLALQLSYAPTNAASFPPTPLSLPLSEPTSATLEIGYVPYPTDRISHTSTRRGWKEWRLLRDWCGEAEKTGEEEGGQEWVRARKVEGGSAGENVDRWIEGEICLPEFKECVGKRTLPMCLIFFCSSEERGWRCCRCFSCRSGRGIFRHT